MLLVAVFVGVVVSAKCTGVVGILINVAFNLFGALLGVVEFTTLFTSVSFDFLFALCSRYDWV